MLWRDQFFGPVNRRIDELDDRNTRQHVESGKAMEVLRLDLHAQWEHHNGMHAEMNLTLGRIEGRQETFLELLPDRPNGGG